MKTVSRKSVMTMVLGLVILAPSLLGCASPPPPPVVGIGMFGPNGLHTGEQRMVQAAISLAAGSPDAHNITVRIILPEGLAKTEGDLEWNGDILQGQSHTLEATIQAIKEGTWEVTAQADSDKYGTVGKATMSVSVSPPMISVNGTYLYPPPWPGVNYYYDPSITINAEVGKEFAIGLNADERLDFHWSEAHNETELILVDYNSISSPPVRNPATEWFLFKAQQVGKTQVSFIYKKYTPIADQRVFTIDIY